MSIEIEISFSHDERRAHQIKVQGRPFNGPWTVQWSVKVMGYLLYAILRGREKLKFPCRAKRPCLTAARINSVQPKQFWKRDAFLCGLEISQKWVGPCGLHFSFQFNQNRDRIVHRFYIVKKVRFTKRLELKGLLGWDKLRLFSERDRGHDRDRGHPLRHRRHRHRS